MKQHSPLKRLTCPVFQALIAFVIIVFSTDTRTDEKSANLFISIIGFRNNNGVGRIAVFSDPEGFPDQPEKAKYITKAAVENQRCVVSFTKIPYGHYAVSVYHDENNNGKLDKRYVFIPTEGYGSSNNPEYKQQAPEYPEAFFSVDTDSVRISIKIRYLFDH